MSGIVQFGAQGAKDYAQAGLDENKIMGETESYISSVIEEIQGLMNKEGKSEEKEPVELKIGDYVKYVPDDKSYDTVIEETGYESSQSFKTDMSVGWRVFDKDEDNIYLISASPVNSDFFLQGADGYNNAVYVLNKACETMYGSTTFGATARSLNIEDVEAHSSYEPTSYTNGAYKNGTEYTITRSNYLNYPNIFKYETGVNIDNTGYTRNARTKCPNGYLFRKNKGFKLIEIQIYNLLLHNE